jgi:hypothetical protein
MWRGVPSKAAGASRTKLQKFSVAWDESVAKGWTVVSMKNDWNKIFPATADK